jgi:predicted Holliday junction resolvase-like endonuclease
VIDRSNAEHSMLLWSSLMKKAEEVSFEAVKKSHEVTYTRVSRIGPYEIKMSVTAVDTRVDSKGFLGTGV